MLSGSRYIGDKIPHFIKWLINSLLKMDM